MVMTHDHLRNQWSQIRKLFPGRTTVTISQRCKHNGHKGTLSLETRERKGVVTCVVDGNCTLTMPMVTHITWSRSFKCMVKMKDTWTASGQLTT